MNLLFDDRYAPITSIFGLLKTSVGLATDTFSEWQENLQRERGGGLKIEPITGTFSEALHCLLPLVSLGPTRSLFVPTKGLWTAYFDNGWRGTDTNAVAYIARELNCEALAVAAIPNTKRLVNNEIKGRYGAIKFSVFSPKAQDPINLLRSVALVNDGGHWVFETFGEIQQFEVSEQYKARRIKDRFTFDLLKKYLEHFDADVFNEGFYMPLNQSALLVEKYGNFHPNRSEFSLIEARQNY